MVLLFCCCFFYCIEMMVARRFYHANVVVPDVRKRLQRLQVVRMWHEDSEREEEGGWSRRRILTSPWILVHVSACPQSLDRHETASRNFGAGTMSVNWQTSLVGTPRHSKIPTDWLDSNEKWWIWWFYSKHSCVWIGWPLMQYSPRTWKARKDQTISPFG